MGVISVSDVRGLVHAGADVAAISAKLGARRRDVRRIIAREGIVRGQADLFIEWLARIEPANAWLARAKRMDDQVNELHRQGLSARAIADKLQIHPYQVREARGRLGVAQHKGRLDDDIDDVRPKRLYRCPMCRKEHWSAPHVRTCKLCKEKLAGEIEDVVYSVGR
ncbi:hypothetical protein [Acidocella sp.]|uniref:hypothetical protein n=1 Tax=Acidocella sp. TaxID=50710 RepID=UPI002615AC87|nr:hypothetical protein [Acidocella sp.]